METSANPSDARLQRTEEGDPDQFIRFDVLLPAKDGAVCSLASRRHWKETSKNDGENILWDRANKRGIIPVSQQAKQVAQRLIRVVPDAVSEFAQIDPLVDVPKSEVEKIYSHVWEPKDKGNSVEPMSNTQGYAGHHRKDLRNSKIPSMSEVFKPRKA